MEPDDAEFLARVGAAALSTSATIQNTFELALAALDQGVPGDLVECGVFAGSQAAVMARALVRRGDRARRVHLFDSFAGIPQAGPMDDATITDLIGPGDGSLRTTGVSACPLAQVRKNMAVWGVPEELLIYHEGWFQEVLPKTQMWPIALLRLDGDLYESTRVCLEHLYPRVSVGGYVIIDDWALTGCRKAVREYLSALGESPAIEAVPDGMGVVWWRKGAPWTS